jgi:hypothetical protein
MSHALSTAVVLLGKVRNNTFFGVHEPYGLGREFHLCRL